MNANWIDPNFIIGNVAKGDNFYLRKDIIEDIWKELKRGNSVLLAAPRRVGKTSIMQYMAEQRTEKRQFCSAGCASPCWKNFDNAVYG